MSISGGEIFENYRDLGRVYVHFSLLLNPLFILKGKIHNDLMDGIVWRNDMEKSCQTLHSFANQ